MFDIQRHTEDGWETVAELDTKEDMEDLLARIMNDPWLSRFPHRSRELPAPAEQKANAAATPG
jgi:hypothetical protein